MKFRKKPVVVEAIQWGPDNTNEILRFTGYSAELIEHLGCANQLYIPTLEGGHTASLYDWIIKGIKGEFYPCKSDIFEQTYERLES